MLLNALVISKIIYVRQGQQKIQSDGSPSTMQVTEQPVYETTVAPVENVQPKQSSKQTKSTPVPRPVPRPDLDPYKYSVSLDAGMGDWNYVEPPKVNLPPPRTPYYADPPEVKWQPSPGGCHINANFC